MAIIAIRKDGYALTPFEGDEYVIDTCREFGGYRSGDLICYAAPFFEIPLELEVAIRKNGEIIFRKWNWLSGEGNHYLHCSAEMLIKDGFHATEEQKDTVAGLFSGRIRFEGIKLAVGASLQEICPIDVSAEQKRSGKNIFLA